MRYTFPKKVRLRKRREFSSLKENSIRYAGKWVYIEAKPSENSFIRLGLTVSRHFGNAVCRNRFKRIMREAFRLTTPEIILGLDMNVKPRQMAHQASMQDIQSELIKFIKPYITLPDSLRS